MVTATHPPAVIVGGDAPTRALCAFLVTELGCTPQAYGSLDELPAGAHAPALVLVVLDRVARETTLPLAALRHWRGHVPLVVLARAISAQSRRQAFTQGVSDVIALPADTRTLLARLGAALGDTPPPPSPAVPLTIQAGGLTLHTAPHRLSDRHGRTVRLTRREGTILGRLMQQPGQVVGRQVLLDEVWGVDYLGDGTVLEVYVHRLRAKLAGLAPSGPHRYVRTVHGQGYTFEARQARRPPTQQHAPTQAVAVRRGGP